MAAGIKGPEPFLYDGCTFARRHDLFNLGDKLLFDLVSVFIHLLMCRRVFSLSLSVFCHLSVAVLAELGRVFLSENHVIVLPSTCVLVWKIKVCAFVRARVCVWVRV